MIILSLDELRLIAQIRNISDYENKSKEDLIKVLNEPKPKPETKSKPETKPITETKPKRETKIIINKKKLEEIKKDFNELRHKFSKREIDNYRESFYNIKKIQTSFHIRNKESRQKSY